MENGRRTGPGLFGRRSDPGRCEDGRTVNGCDGIEGSLGADVAEQAAVLVGAVLLMLGIERAPLAQDGEAKENDQTNGPSVRELSPSFHAYSIICKMTDGGARLQVSLGQNQFHRREPEMPREAKP
jgi:hypothetical protein